MTIGFILAGGIGERFGATIPKQYMSLNGKYVIQYAIDSLYESKSVDKIVVINHDGFIPSLLLISLLLRLLLFLAKKCSQHQRHLLGQ